MIICTKAVGQRLWSKVAFLTLLATAMMIALQASLGSRFEVLNSGGTQGGEGLLDVSSIGKCSRKLRERKNSDPGSLLLQSMVVHLHLN